MLNIISIFYKVAFETSKYTVIAFLRNAVFTSLLNISCIKVIPDVSILQEVRSKKFIVYPPGKVYKVFQWYKIKVNKRIIKVLRNIYLTEKDEKNYLS